MRWIDAFLDQEQLLELIEAADIYVTPYRNLAQITSGTLAYAVALGKPVVSTPYQHAAEIVRPGNGILVEPGASGAFAAAISRLLGDDELRRGHGAQRLCARPDDALAADSRGFDGGLRRGDGAANARWPGRLPIPTSQAAWAS